MPWTHRPPFGAARRAGPAFTRALAWTLLGAVVLVASLVALPPRSARAADGYQPWSMIVSLDIKTPTGARSCTGFMLGPHTVGTAGHCIYDANSGGWASTVRVTPGVNGLIAPYASLYATGYATTERWANDGDLRYDFGVIQLGTDDLGQATGWFDVVVQDDQQLIAGTFNTAGYRADRPYQTMWSLSAPRPLSAVDPSFMYYRWDVTHGQSGSPVFFEANGRYGVVGLVNACRGTICNASSVDFGVRVTGPISDFFRAQVAAPVQRGTATTTPTIFTKPAGEHVALKIQGQSNAAAVLQRSTDAIRWETIQSGTTDATGEAAFNLAATTTAFYRGVVVGTGTTPPVRGVVEPSGTISATARGTFAALPTYSASGLGNAVFLAGTVDDLDAALAASGASGAWAQTSNGAWVLYIVRGGSAVNVAFMSAFPQGFTGPVALTLVRR